LILFLLAVYYVLFKDSLSVDSEANSGYVDNYRW